MKNILKITTSLFAIVALWSCTNDHDQVISANGFTVRKVAEVVSPAVLSEANKTQDYIKLNWDRANNGVASESIYSILLSDHDVPPSESNVVETRLGLNLNDLDAREATLTVDQFNTLINQLPSFNCGVMNIDIKIKSKLGVSSNALYQYSNPITVAVTGYAKKPLILAFARATDNVTQAQKITSLSFDDNNYEGFMYLEAGDYKFFKPDPCGTFSSPAVYGISGGNSGTLVESGTISYNVPTTGHYFIKADLGAGTYSITPFNNTTAANVLGIFGQATKTIGFANTTPMTYDAVNKKWSITISLINGKKFSFKTGTTSTPATILIGSGTAITTAANPLTTYAGTFPVDATVNQGSIKAPGDYVNDTTKTKYNIELDLSKPRNYSFTIAVNPN